MDLTGYPHEPPAKVGASLADVTAGLYALQGILLALLARERTGQGQAIDISLLDTTVSTLTYQAMIYFATGRPPERMGTRHPSIVPYECFQTKDGFINIGVTNEKQWGSFCRALALYEAASDPRFETMADRLTHYEELKPIIEKALSGRTRAEVRRLLAEHDIAVGPVNSVAEILEDPHIHARQMVVELVHPEYGPLKVLGIPVKLSDTPGLPQGAPPHFGEHNRDILGQLGYDDRKITALTADKVIVEAPARTQELAESELAAPSRLRKG
jgi:crotonobetainyl-CoA:carnitine CoA-transferase CaiB-like acyl-CoA transferase